MKSWLALAILLLAHPALAESGASSAVNLGLDGGGWSTLGRSSGNGNGSASLVLYSLRIKDDDSPLSLQPYLQRLSTVTITAAGGAFSTTDPSWPSSYSGNFERLTVALDQYFNDTFALTALATAERQANDGPYPGSTSPSYFTPVFEVGPAVRLGDTRFDLFYRSAPVYSLSGGHDDGRGWGQLGARLESAIARILFVELDGNTLISGAAARLSFNYYYTQALQLGAGAGIERGQIFFNTSALFTRFDPHADVSYWFNHSLRGIVSYHFYYTSGDVGLTTQEHHVFIGALIRFG